GDGGAQTLGAAGGIDHPIVGGDGEGASFEPGGDLRVDAGARADGEFGGVASELVYAAAVGVEDHGDEEAEFAIAEHGDALAGGDGDLVEDLAGGSERLQEHGAAGGDVVGEDVQVALREGEEFGERAGVADDSQHGAVGAVASQSAAAPFAMGAGEIDFSGHALAEERGRVRFGHLGDELVTGRTGEGVVAALEFEIGVADAAGQEAQEREARGPGRDGQGAGGDDAVFQVNCQVNCEHALIIELHACGTSLYRRAVPRAVSDY